MPNYFGTRIMEKDWCASLGNFELYMRATVPYLEKSSPEMAEQFGFDFYYCSGMGFFASSMSLDEEKHVLEALKCVYRDKTNEMTQLPDGSWDKNYLAKTLPHFQELIVMLEEEVHDIERGKLIIQEDGTAIINENFKEE